MDEILDLITDLMRFKTTSDNPEEIGRCAEYIIKYLRGNRMVIKKFIKKGKISIVATFKDTKKPKIFFNAHFDVVPASNHLFAPKIEGDKLYGRGSHDCKGQIAMLMYLMKHFAKQKTRPNIGIMLTSDEEVYGANGVDYLISEHAYSSDFAIVADGGDNFDIVTKHKGVLHVRLSTLGKTAHSSRYWEGGVNAIENLIVAYAKIKKLFPKLTKAEWRTTANLSLIKGGDVVNQVPDYAELYLDIRYTERDPPDVILKKLEKIKGIQVEKVEVADMLNTSASNPYIKKLKKAAESVLKKAIRLHYEHGATDARYFSAKGIPAVLFMPLGYGAHSDDEHLLISSLEPYFKILVKFVNSAT